MSNQNDLNIRFFLFVCAGVSARTKARLILSDLSLLLGWAEPHSLKCNKWRTQTFRITVVTYFCLCKVNLVFIVFFFFFLSSFKSTSHYCHRGRLRFLLNCPVFTGAAHQATNLTSVWSVTMSGFSFWILISNNVKSGAAAATEEEDGAVMAILVTALDEC